MNQNFDDVAGIVDVPNLERFNEDTLDEKERYFSVRNYGVSRAKIHNLIDNNPLCPSGVSDQNFHYVICDFANRHGLEATLAKGNSIILAGSKDIPMLVHQEFGDKFLVEPRGAKFLKIMLKRMRDEANTDKKEELSAPHYYS